MRFYTHDRTPKTEIKKPIKIRLSIVFAMQFSLFLFSASVCSIYSRSIIPAVLILTPILMLAIFIVITQRDMDKACIEIVDNVITVTDYYFGVKKEKTFIMHDIASTEVLVGSSLQVRGYRYTNLGCTYIVFRDNKNRYMFKIICVPETKQFFDNYF